MQSRMNVLGSSGRLCRKDRLARAAPALGFLGRTALAAAVLLAGPVWCQEFRATLVGRVLDPSGAPVPGATVTVTQRATNQKYSAVTTETGDYTVPFLAPGEYRLEVEKPGFRRAVRDNILLRIQDRAGVDVVLEIGVQTEIVEVRAATELLETASASLGQVVSDQMIQDIPLNGRSPYTLIRIAAGVLPTYRAQTDFFLRNTSTGQTTTAQISISGAPSNYNEWLLDGVPTTGDDNGLMYIPSLEASQEFKVQTNSFDAEFGRFLGGVVNASMRSGTNQFHGAAFEFLRNSALNARDFFAASKPQFGYNQFGISGGGPVWLPRLYDGRNRTFLFMIYDGSREGVPRSFVSTVPTELQRQGDFSETMTRVAGAPARVTIYDPQTTRPSGSAWVRDPFPGNVIPAVRINPVGRKLLDFYPLPSALGDAVTRTQNFPLAYKDPVLDNGIAFKVDHRFSPSHSVFLRYSWRHFFVQGQGAFKNAATSRSVNRYMPGVALDDTLTLSPTTVLNFRYGFSRYHQNTRSDGFGFDLASLGFPASLARAVDRPAPPNVSLSGYTGYGTFTLDNDVTETHFFRGSVLKQKGRHALRSGASYRILRHNNGPGGTNPGAFSFDGVFTRGPNPQVTSATAGNAVASMLLGLGASGSVTYLASVAEQTPYSELYVQDDIRLTGRVSLNLGLRYEWEGAHTERFDRFNRGFDYTSPSPIEAQAAAAYARSPIPEVPASQFAVKGGLLFAHRGGLPRALTDIDRNNVSPRVGVAFTLTPQTVLRGGYGRFYGPTTPESETSFGFSATTPWVTTVDGGLTPVDTLSDPFPKGILPPPGYQEGLLTQVGQSISFVNPRRTQLYTTQFQFSLQRQFPGGIVAEASYSGTRGGEYSVTRSIDEIPEKWRAQAREIFVATRRNVLNDSVSNPFFGLISTGALSGRTTTRGQLTRPYPHFTAISRIGNSIGSSRYHALQLKAHRRLSHGLTFLASYTISKLIEQNFFLNPTDEQLSRRLASFDVPQRFVVSGSYQLPFGKGRPLGADVRGLPGVLISGWQMNWVYSAQAGVPLTISSGESLGRSAKLPNSQRTLSRWFDTSAFRLRETLELVGTARLPDVRSHGRNNMDFSLYKDTRLSEALRLQFRAESFNLFNRAEFGDPNTTVGSASFGVISSQINYSRQLQFGLRLLW